MFADISIAIVIICIPGMIHVLLPKQMAHLYEKSYRSKMESWGKAPGNVTLRPGFVLLFGMIWIAVGLWMIVNAIINREG